MSGYPADFRLGAATVVADSRVAALQIEGALARQQVGEGRTAWLAPSVRAFSQWAGDTWRDHLDDGSFQPLTHGQVGALWRRVVEASSVGGHGFSGYRQAAAWARQASRQRRRWNLDLAALRKFRHDPDCAALLQWEQAYRRALDASAWLDSTDIEDALIARAAAIPDREGESIVWADPTPQSAGARLWRRFRDLGRDFGTWKPPTVEPRCRRVRLATASDEVRAAAAWAAGRLDREPGLRLAIVIPGIEARREAFAGILQDTLDPARAGLDSDPAGNAIVFLQGRPAVQDAPAIGAALTALELYTDSGDFRVLSRWLRSPFFVPDAVDAEARSLVEVRLRAHVSSQLTVLDGLDCGSLAAAIGPELPGLAGALADAAATMRSSPETATPTRWGDVWRRVLDRLGWHGGAADADARDQWEAALHELALLTPILGKVALDEALAELEAILQRPAPLGAAPLHGVYVLANPEDVAWGYDALWICGLTDTQWPRAPQPSPLLPVSLQRAHGMPLATPDAVLEHSRATLQRLVESVPDVVLSSPGVVHEHPTQPSPLIRPYPEVRLAELVPDRPRPANSGPGRIETCPDPVPAVAGKVWPGGVRTLAAHSRCPLRAFIESRLRARPLETVESGLGARQRGMLIHSAARQLLADRPAQADIAAWSGAERARRIHSSCETALRGLFGSARSRLRALYGLEAERLRSILAGLLEMDLRRSPFQVVAVEQPLEVDVGGLELSCRIDRIDRLEPAGTLAVIDYKSGSRRGPGDWLAERPRDPQLPCYAAVVAGEVAAVAIAVLRGGDPGYAGYWSPPDAFPGHPSRWPEGLTWSVLRRRWRGRIEALAREYAAGDGRIFPADAEAAGGAMASLTRVHERAAATMSDAPPEVGSGGGPPEAGSGGGPPEAGPGDARDACLAEAERTAR